MKWNNLFRLLMVLFAVIALAPQPTNAATPCGGAGQRACCVTERPPGASCNQGFHEVQGCTGDCRCGGANPFDALNSIGHCEANFVPDPCGGPGQRACCVTERPPGASCNPGFHEEGGCNASNGNCICGGPNPGNFLKSIGHCVANPTITNCGGQGQRACCVTERPGQPSCNQGLHEEGNCAGNCICGGPNPGFALKSIGVCVANPSISQCGGPGQRACCVTERPGQPSCNAGFHEEGGCSGNCVCGGPNPLFALKSLGHCVANTCGGPGQRACCITERPVPCDQGLHQEPGCTGDCRCGGANPGGALNAIGHCVANPVAPAATPCGGQGQRACCITERATPCNQGFDQVQGCTGDCRCGGANPLGALNAIGHCEPNCETRKTQLEAELAKANAEIANLKKLTGQGAGTGKTIQPAAQPKQQLQQPLIKQAPRQLIR